MKSLIFAVLFLPSIAWSGPIGIRVSAGAASISAGSIDTTKLAADAVTSTALLYSTASLRQVSGGEMSIDGSSAISISTDNLATYFMAFGSSPYLAIGTNSSNAAMLTGPAYFANSNVGKGLLNVGWGSYAGRIGVFGEGAQASVTLANSGSSAPVLFMRKSTGTLLSPMGIGNGSTLGTIQFGGLKDDNATSIAMTQIQSKTDASGVATGSYPSDIELSVTRPGAITTTVSAIVTSTGSLGLGRTTAASVSQFNKLDVNGSADIINGLSVGQSAAQGYGLFDVAPSTGNNVPSTILRASADNATGYRQGVHIGCTGAAGPAGDCITMWNDATKHQGFIQAATVGTAYTKLNLDPQAVGVSVGRTEPASTLLHMSSGTFLVDGTAAKIQVGDNTNPGTVQVGASTGTTTSGTTGHLDFTQLNAPGIACNAGSPSIASSSSDMAGKFTGGAASANCTVTFKSAFAIAPACFCADESNILALKAVSTTTTLVCTSATSIGTDVVAYGCLGIR